MKLITPEIMLILTGVNCFLIIFGIIINDVQTMWVGGLSALCCGLSAHLLKKQQEDKNDE